jgi:hypothetical protein
MSYAGEPAPEFRALKDLSPAVMGTEEDLAPVLAKPVRVEVQGDFRQAAQWLAPLHSGLVNLWPEEE